jgi:hypothetical protein
MMQTPADRVARNHHLWWYVHPAQRPVVLAQRGDHLVVHCPRPPHDRIRCKWTLRALIDAPWVAEPRPC